MICRLLITAALVLASAVPLLAADEYEERGRRWWSHVEYLASDKLEGRNTGSPGHRLAAEYVAGEFERARLRPAGTQGYFQPVKFEVRKLDEASSSLALVRGGSAQTLRLGTDANLGIRADPAPHIEAEAVFVGYGLQAPELNYDDLAGLDLKGKIAVYLSGAPAFFPAPLAAHLGTERWKGLRAAGAVGVASFSDPKHTDVPWARMTLARLQPSMVLADPRLRSESSGMQLSVLINPEHAGQWFAGTGHTVAEIFELAEANKPLPKFPLTVKVRAEVSFTKGEVTSDNVAAILPGSDPVLAKEYVVLSAHLDHVGVGGAINGDKIYNGAMDNATGIASLIEIARDLSSRAEKPKRSVLFLAVTAEEKGLLGSKYFAANPTIKPDTVVANLNLDMYLPLFPLKSLVVYGIDESTLGGVTREVASTLGIEIAKDREPKRNLFVRSDQYSFIRRGVPALFFKFEAPPGSPEEKRIREWIKVRYHAPSDDPQQPVDAPAAARFNDFVARLASRVASGAERPAWTRTSFFRRFAGHKGESATAGAGSQ